jgi:hypothetical protein
MRTQVRPQFLNGADSIRGGEAVRRQMEARQEWPYPHVFPPSWAIPVNAVGSVEVPTTGQTVNVITYSVPDGFELELWATLIDYEGVFIPGDSLFTLQVNNESNLTNPQATVVQGLTNIPVPLGSWKLGQQWHFWQRYRFAPLDVLQWSAANANLTAGPPNAYVGGFFGFLLPAIDKS